MADLQDKVLIGSEEWFGFPSLGIPAMKARIDSGAKTSSIHAVNITPFKRKGEPWVSFEVHPLQKDRRTLVRCEAPVVDRRAVKSSSGETSRRYVIRVPMTMGDDAWDIELTLANRDSMGYRMLLGREAMVGRFLVDPGGRFIHGDLTAPFLKEAYGGLAAPANGLSIGLLGIDEDSYTNQRLIEAAEERGHSVDFLDVRHCYMKLDADALELHYRGGYLLSKLDAVLPRLTGTAASTEQYSTYGCALVRQCESLDVACLNGSSAISQTLNKILALQLLLEDGLDIPVTAFADSPVDTAEVIDLVGGAPLIIKLLNGAQGRGVAVAETDIAAESLINTLKSVEANLLVQEFIKEAQGKDIRCLVIDGKVVASVERTAVAEKFRGNARAGGAVRAAKISSEEKKLAIKAAKAMDLHMAGVNIIRSSKGPLLLEVDPAPDLEELENATNRDLASVVIAAIEKQLNWRRELAANP